MVDLSARKDLDDVGVHGLMADAACAGLCGDGYDAAHEGFSLGAKVCSGWNRRMGAVELASSFMMRVRASRRAEFTAASISAREGVVCGLCVYGLFAEGVCVGLWLKSWMRV